MYALIQFILVFMAEFVFGNLKASIKNIQESGEIKTKEQREKSEEEITDPTKRKIAEKIKELEREKGLVSKQKEEAEKYNNPSQFSTYAKMQRKIASAEKNIVAQEKILASIEGELANAESKSAGNPNHKTKGTDKPEVSPSIITFCNRVFYVHLIFLRFF